MPETSTIISRCLHVYNKLEDFFYVDVSYFIIMLSLFSDYEHLHPYF